MTLSHSDALKKFITHLEDLGRSPSTVVAYKKDIEQLFEYFNNKINTVDEYESKHLKNYVELLVSEQRFTLKTISRKINSYKTLFKFLHKENHVTQDAAQPISHPKFTPKQPRILSSLEYRALRDTARSNTRLYAMIEILLQTGMRIGELSRLTLEDLQIEKTPYTVTIQEYASNPERVIELNKDAVDAIQGYLEKRPHPKKDAGLLFITKTGKQVLVRNIRTMINNAFKKSGISDVTVNDIRNTFIVYQLEHGMPLERVAEIVGHQRLTSTEKYLNLLTNRKAAATTKIVSL
ncbi:tyrosine-type recombinase/integrase [Candidatus Dojkabacteria bacterium]|uniref:Tyrosine-type recombinase/integrase n=1 Tax=Candidatus Dojkabacteria bacterium TaxID=2099670 RepID=A0A955L7K5_9BACT|nr:tyrosine-type recombinase/integrase [Candidatus Dojkabacteria bacterium]